MLGDRAGISDVDPERPASPIDTPLSEYAGDTTPETVNGLRSSPPISLIVGVSAGLLLFALTQFPLRDIDLYWHLRAGAELLAGVSVGQVGADWSFAPDPLDWVTTQWLAEVVLRLLHDAGGWSALIAYRTVTAGIAVAILAHGTFRGRPAILAGFPFLVAAAAAITYSQERPNQATLIGAALLGPALVRGLNDVGLPRWWLLLPGTWIWANYHGGWVLVPVVMLLISSARILDHGFRDRTAWRAMLVCLASVLVGSLTPAGAASTLATLRFSSAAGLIQEWMRTIPLEVPGLLTTAMAFLIAISWARSSVPRSEAFVTLVLVAFSWTAIRNVAPAVMLLAPLVAARLTLAFPRVGREPEPRWSAPLGIIVASGLILAGLVAVPGRDHLPRQEFPVALAQQIREIPGAQRVLNDYNAAGLVLYFAKPEDQVGIDGRTDRYGADYIRSYTGLANLEGDWESLLAELAPTLALLEGNSALAQVLVAQKGWTQLGQDGDWVLLSAPPDGV